MTNFLGKNLSGDYNYHQLRKLAERMINMAEFSIEKFESSRKENGVCFWYAHEFMHSLGYTVWGTFQAVITRAMGSCTKLGLDPTESFVSSTYIDNGRPCKTYKLTRFACFLISMHADSKKPEVAAAKTILAAIADQLIAEKIGDSALGRLETRDDLKLAEKVMSGVAQDAGLENNQFGIFKNAGFLGMYNMGIKSLGKHKGISTNDTLYDFMGLEELAGNLFRVTQTAARIKNQKVTGLNPLSTTATEVGQEVRTIMLKNGGIAPESLPIEVNISTVKSKLKNANKQMKKLDNKKKQEKLTT